MATPNKGSLRLNRTRRLTRLWRTCHIALLFIGSTFAALCLYPLCSDATRLRLKSSSSRALLKALGIELEAI